MTPTRRRLLGSLATWIVVAAALRVTLLAPEDCPSITADEARAGAVRAAEWIRVNQHDDGSYLYLLERDGARVVDDYNLVRHAGTTMSLYQLVVAGGPEYLPAADLALEWMLERTRPTGTGPDAGAVFHEPGTQARMGASALLVVSLAHRRAATGDTSYDDTMRAVGRFLVEMQRPDGSMLAFWSPQTGAPVPDETSLYFTGEALWAFALLHREFPGESWNSRAWPTLEYVTTVRDAEEDVFPAPWPDQWAAYSLREMASWGLGRHHLSYARRIAAQFATMVRWEAQQTSGPSTLWLGTVTHGPAPSAAGQGTWLEALGMLWELSIADTRLGDIRDDLEGHLVCSAGRLLDRQVVEAEPGEDPALVVGAWFTDGRTQVDDQQHGLSGLLFAERALRQRDAEVTRSS